LIKKRREILRRVDTFFYGEQGTLNNNQSNPYIVAAREDFSINGSDGIWPM